MKELITSILSENHIYEECEEMHTSGLANRIFATESYIIRIPTDHEEALNDSRTESIAAPAAIRHGIKTPKLIKYDDSCKIMGKSYSIWERIHGSPLGRLREKFSLKDAWVDVGRELGKLHTSVMQCDDPNGWLDSPDREYSKEEMVGHFGTRNGYSEKILGLIEDTFTPGTFTYVARFVHGDAHDENIMCNDNGEFTALIDWGDSGWADPAIDFYMMPGRTIGWALKGYAQSAHELIDKNFLNRIILDKIWMLIEEQKNDKELYDEIEKLRVDIKANITEAMTYSQ